MLSSSRIGRFDNPLDSERRNVDLQFPSTSEDMSDIVSSDEETVSYSVGVLDY